MKKNGKTLLSLGGHDCKKMTKKISALPSHFGHDLNSETKAINKMHGPAMRSKLGTELDEVKNCTTS